MASAITNPQPNLSGSMSALPDELVVLILGYLDVDSLLVTSRVGTGISSLGIMKLYAR